MSNYFYIVIFILFFFSTRYNCQCFASQECTDDDGEKIKCSEHGKCYYNYVNNISLKNNKTVECKCNKGYITLNDNDEIKCCYPQKKQLIAFTYEMLISFGLGHIYIGNKSLGYLKLGIYCSFLLYLLFYIYAVFNTKKTNINVREYKKGKECNNNHFILFTIILILNIVATITWQIFDFVFFGLNMYKDNNGAKLLSW